MSDSPMIIGHHEQIQIVDHAVADIPAKIDTGANSSAIWASNIAEHDGLLNFTLFGAGSVYFTGVVLQTDKYRVISIKNSFGESEYRYIVTLTIKIAGKRYKVHFTLADRSRSNFPMLLGKRFLNKKFLVDVSRNHLLEDNQKAGPQKILVLCSALDAAKQEFFAKVAAAASAQVSVHHYKDLLFRFGEKPQVQLRTSQGLVDVADFDLVYFKSHKSNLEAAMAVGRYLHYRNVNFIDREFGQLVSRSKLSEMMQLQTFGLPVPSGVVASHQLLLEQAKSITDELGWPVIVKDVFSDKGINNYQVQNMAELRKILEKAADKQLFVIQKLITNNGYSRVLVMGKEAKLVISRLTLKSEQKKLDPQKQHLDNIRGGINASLQPVESADATMISLSQKAADVMQRQVAGVDILQDKQTGKWYILEVNSSPQLITKKFSDEKAQAMGQYLKREAERWYL
ncbi:MAG: RimK/LysX family protein [Candidatus Saccharimonadales bacterium]